MRCVKRLLLTFLLCGSVCAGETAFAGMILSPSKGLMAGQTVYILSTVPQNFYAVYWVNASNPAQEDACAYIEGTELAQDNDLTHYGTCFVNDTGQFKIIELTEPVYDVFTQAKSSIYSLGFISFGLSGFFPIPGTPILTPAQLNDKTTIRNPAFNVSCTAGYTVRIYSDNAQVGSGLCPTGGIVQLTSSVEIPYGLQFMTAKHLDSQGNLSIAGEGLALSVVQRLRRIINME